MQLFSSLSAAKRVRASQLGGAKASVLYLICILALAGVAGLLFSRSQSAQKELAGHRAVVQENTELKQQAAELAQLRAENQELQALRKDSGELLRLRNEVTILRGLTNQLSKLVGENAQLKSTLQKAQASVADANILRNQNQQLQGALATQQENAVKLQCIQNLRAIQATKQAWAQDNNRLPTDTPPDAELFGPNRYMPQRPVCPAGGNYAVGAVQANSICSVPGHAL